MTSSNLLLAALIAAVLAVITAMALPISYLVAPDAGLEDRMRVVEDIQTLLITSFLASLHRAAVNLGGARWES